MIIINLKKEVISLSILDNISKYKSIVNDGQPGTLKTQEEAIIEIANYVIEYLPILIQDILNYAIKNSIADTIVWGFWRNPVASISSQKVSLGIFIYETSLMFDGRLAMGHSMRNDMPKIITTNQISAVKTVNFSEIQRTITSVDDVIYEDFPQTLDQLFVLSYGITETAQRINISTERVTSIKKLSAIGSDILKKYRYW